MSEPQIKDLIWRSVRATVTRRSCFYTLPSSVTFTRSSKGTVRDIKCGLVVDRCDQTTSCTPARSGRVRLGVTGQGFIDRRYTDDGHLLSRKIDGAVIKDQTERLEQALALATTGKVITHSGATLTLKTGSLCVHGDSAGAVETARQARAAIEANGLTIKAFA